MQCNRGARAADQPRLSRYLRERGSYARPFYVTWTRMNQYQSTIDAPQPTEQCCVMQLERPERSSERSLVSVVDDDESVRESLPDLLREFGFASRVFHSAEAFLSSDCIDKTKCLILDVCMPGVTGLDLHRQLKLRGRQIPTIF